MDHREQEVINGLKQGDNWAYKRLYDCHYVLLCKVAFAFLKDDYLAQTVVEDLIVNLYEKRETLDITSSVRTYLARSVRNQCLNYLQTKYEQNVVNFSELNDSDDWLSSISATNDDCPDDALLETELAQKIHQAIRQLPDECRKVFEKSRFEEKQYKDIAVEMNISVNTVKYHIKNALAHLRKALAEYF